MVDLSTLISHTLALLLISIQYIVKKDILAKKEVALGCAIPTPALVTVVRIMAERHVVDGGFVVVKIESEL